MFEHMKNYKLLIAKVASWLRPDANSLLFVQIICHHTTPYHFEEDDSWMARNFFSGSLQHIRVEYLLIVVLMQFRWDYAVSRSLRALYTLN